MQPHVGQGAVCSACHDPHGTSNNSMIFSKYSGVSVSFSGSDFVNGQGTGVCQVCHTSTLFYKKGVAETSHPASGCTSCHLHNTPSGVAFQPNSACNGCHGYPPAPRKVTSAVTFGFSGQWSSARFEDYSGGGGAHLVAGHIPMNANPADGWINCIPCHKGGAATHSMILPLASHVENVKVAVDPQYRFSDSFISYTSAKMVSGGGNKSGSCFNVACHFVKTPKWSIER
jgi:predicted CXXCH cytochrome family protein